MGSASAVCRLASCSFFARIALACRFAFASVTVRKALALEGRLPATISAAAARSSSAIRAPRGSDWIAAIDPGRGPIPNRCRASAACAFAEVLMAPLRRMVVRGVEQTDAEKPEGRYAL